MKKRILIILGMFLAVSVLTACGRSSDEGPAPAPANPTAGVLKLNSIGAANIGGLDMMVNLPAGITVDADATTGEAAAGAVTASGAAAGTNSLASAKLIPATTTSPAQLHVVVVNANGFGEGECVTIKFNVNANATFPADKSAFSVVVNGAVAADANSTPLTNVTVSTASLATES
jgi:hypothetical protein